MSTALTRSDRLKEPPIVGSWYLVPAILWNRNIWGETLDSEKLLSDLQSKGSKWWPVWGIKHNDADHFNFPALHYHIDPRFLTKRQIAEFTNRWSDRTWLQNVQAAPLNHLHLKAGPPRPVLRRMRCTIDHSEWGFGDRAAVISLNTAFVGKKCGSGKRGLVCPHRHFPLGSVKSRDGIVTCPLHGLRIDIETGKCVGPLPEAGP